MNKEFATISAVMRNNLINLVRVINTFQYNENGDCISEINLPTEEEIKCWHNVDLKEEMQLIESRNFQEAKRYIELSLFIRNCNRCSFWFKSLSRFYIEGKKEHGYAKNCFIEFNKEERKYRLVEF